jgi:hypothetical protein
MVIHRSVEEHHNADEEQVESEGKGKVLVLVEILQTKDKSSDEAKLDYERH